jgi:hypothetical protein
MKQFLAIVTILYVLTSGTLSAESQDQQLTPFESRLIGTWVVPIHPTLKKLGMFEPTVQFNPDHTAIVKRGVEGNRSSATLSWRSVGDKVVIEDINQVKKNPGSKEVLGDWTFVEERGLVGESKVYILYESGKREELIRAK